MACGKCGGGCGPIIVRPDLGDISVLTSDQELKILCDDLGQFLRRYTTDDEGNVSVTDTLLDGVSPYFVTGDVGICEPDSVPESPGDLSPGVLECGNTELAQLCDLVEVSPGESPGESGQERIPFLRKFTFDCDGNVLAIDDLDLDGFPYQVQGEVVLCSEVIDQDTCGLPEDAVTEGSNTTGELQAVDVIPPPLRAFRGSATGPNSHEPLPGGGQDLWDGGALQFGPDTEGAGGGELNYLNRVIAGSLQVQRPECDNGTAELTVQVHAELMGPNPAVAQYYGGLRLYNARTEEWFAYDPVAEEGSRPGPGYSYTMTVNSTVPAVDLANGDIYVWVALETYEGSSLSTGPKEWMTADFEASYVFNTDGCIQEAPVSNVRICEPLTIKWDVPPEGAGDADPAYTIEKVCRCDDTTGDGIPDTAYVEYWKISEGNPNQLLGIFLADDLGTEYDPVNSVPCDAEGDQLVAVQAHRVELAPGMSWNSANFPLLQSVTFTNVNGGNPTITTADGTSNLWPGESISWGVTKDYDAVLQGPLSVQAGADSTVVVSWTEGVTA